MVRMIHTNNLTRFAHRYEFADLVTAHLPVKIRGKVTHSNPVRFIRKSPYEPKSPLNFENWEFVHFIHEGHNISRPFRHYPRAQC
jgi:hypothetical protein